MRASVPVLILAVLLLAPLAAAADTLASLEEPHKGEDKVWDITILQSEAGKQNAIVFRNPITTPFELVVYDAEGKEVYQKRGTRGVQTLPALDAGEYRFFVRGFGAFQVTSRALERDNVTNVSTTLDGVADAYVLASRKHYDVGVEGDVDVEWWDLTLSPDLFRAPGNRSAHAGGAYVLTVSGQPGTPYAISLSETDAHQHESPGAGVLVAVGALALVALVARRRRL